MNTLLIAKLTTAAIATGALFLAVPLTQHALGQAAAGDTPVAIHCPTPAEAPTSGCVPAP